MDTAYNIRKNKTLAYLAELITAIQLNNTFVVDFKSSKQLDISADCVSRKCLEEYTINVKLLVPNEICEDK